MEMVGTRRVLLAVCAAIMVLHVVAVGVRTIARPTSGALPDVLALLNAAQERSLASWWTSALLVACCLVATAASLLASGGMARGWVTWAWLVLAVVFAVLSLDEVVSLHERGAEWTASVFETSSLLGRLGWTIPATAILVLSLAVLVPAFRALPSRPRLLILAGLTTSIGGALGMEVVNVLLTDAGARYLWRHTAMAVEEAAEMTGVVIVLLGLLTAVQVRRADRQFTVTYDIAT
ncbi:hypothetical protein E1218_25745 [Kribbella turkmenica]|uniref:Uncharacterized protein n=1 Tax=Kribbella turkmenica TaxID=2530375 RepID=A0A4R4WNN4_9ACTN|nr:hypothetical protein [Kribbella turkmenica]TDD18594.1 hypothetical protein E1218_25745 [Kribbella turkmenica]